MASELYLMEVGDGRYSILLCDDRSITQMPALTPAETLIAFSELDYMDYRKAVRWLRNEHPLFEERIDIPVSDLEDFAAEAILLTPDLCEIDPVSGFVVTDILHQTLQAEDDGTAMFLLAAGQEMRSGKAAAVGRTTVVPASQPDGAADAGAGALLRAGQPEGLPM